MKKRLLKALAAGTIFIWIIPFVVITGVIWVINGKKSPADLFVNFNEWLEKNEKS